ncbi:hypothetical protein ACFE04_004000 [Oxalis oulophora]
MKHVCLLCFVIILAVFSNESFSQDTDLITKTCDKTLHKELCNSILRLNAESAHADVHGLAKIVLQTVKSNAWKIREHIMALTNWPSDNTLIKMCLKEFQGNMANAIHEIEESMKAMDDRRYNDVKSWVSAAMTNLDTCGDGFDAKPVYDRALTDLMEVYTKVCSIELGITNSLSGVISY